ncbi:SMI1/KNR4 family protein [Streptomyces sp. NBC_01476]|uniref:SMI1/KNR4 family protein n=1 Tax=Streptomyces sp. NBC_01476 TaxID=2903881 RepID=UPI002E332B42|nr:SMI1/KNR4 family protein [Streptomyces sp. NBC_01476]
MNSNYLILIAGVLGEGSYRFADEGAWRDLEESLGFALPSDYKQIVDAYGPICINDDFYLSHPATQVWNLGEEIRNSAGSWSAVVWDEDSDLEFDPREALGIPEMRFATADGLTPVAGTSQSQTVFLAPGVAPQKWRIIVHNRGDFEEYRMGFAEWFYLYLSGADAFGPLSAEEPVVPAELRLLPGRAGDAIETVYGPRP